MDKIEEITQLIYDSQDSDADRKEFGTMPYCTIPFPEFEHLGGRRDCKVRFERFEIGPKDLTGKSVIDLGCNVGGMVFEALNRGSVSAIGVDHNPKFIGIAKEVAGFKNIERHVNFIEHDLDTFNTDAQFDVSFCLAVDLWVKNANRLYNLLGRITKETLYLESHREYQARTNADGLGPRPDVATFTAELQKAGFRTVEYLHKPQFDTIKDYQTWRPNYICRK